MKKNIKLKFYFIYVLSHICAIILSVKYAASDWPSC